jgi:hydroxymethylpyrimidine/phosphomethylpyrimidine kinase
MSDEPKKTKSEEGRTISCGIRGVIKQAKKAPDIIYHRGDLGKEPIIIIFGKNPRDVLGKLASVI